MALMLAECFEYAGIDISELSVETMQEVKKILLLELKSSGEDTLLIGGARYSKNDLLDFFENGSNPDQFSAPAETNPKPESAGTWHEQLAKPEELNSFFDMPDELLDPDKLEEAKLFTERNYGKGIIVVAQRRLRDGEHDKLQYLLSFAPVFSGTFSYDLKQALLILLKNQLLKLQNEAQLRKKISDFRQTPFFKRSFYSTIHFLKDMDADLSRQILQVAVEMMNVQELSVPERRALFELFLLLPMDDNIEEYIRKNIETLDAQLDRQSAGAQTKEKTAAQPEEKQEAKAERKQAKNLNSAQNLSIRRAARVAVWTMIIVGGIAMLAKCITDSFGKKTETKAEALERAMMDDQYINYYFDEADIIQDYKKLRWGIESNVNQPAVRGFMINQLSRFCYDMDVDSAHSKLTFEPVKPLPESVQLHFSNSSKFSKMLVLIFDEEHPDAPVRGAIIPRNKDYSDTILYIFPTDRIVVLANPVIENGNTVVAAKMATTETFNSFYESYRLKSGTPKNSVHLSSSEYQEGMVSIIHIYETMRFKRLVRKY